MKGPILRKELSASYLQRKCSSVGAVNRGRKATKQGCDCWAKSYSGYIDLTPW